MSDLREELQAQREALRELTQQSVLDEAEVRNVADTQGDLKADMIVLRAQRHAKIAAILTDDQRAQLEEMRSKRRHYR
jgi:Spy/CpxP family protein refolding chaperone